MTGLGVPKGPIYRDNDHKRRLESRNGILQTQFLLHTAESWNAGSRFTPELLRELQRLAVNQIYRCAGYFRDGAVTIQEVDHQPPPWQDIPRLVAEMCEYVNGGPGKSPIHLSAYVMWRVNWIHPFFGGNGRTARAASYLVLCVRLGFIVPGSPTIPELIVEQRAPYYGALRAADAAWAEGRLDLTKMEDLLSSLLAKQLLSVHQRATGLNSP